MLGSWAPQDRAPARPSPPPRLLEARGSRGAVPGSFLSHPPPPALSSSAGSWAGEGAEAGAGAGSRPRGSRKRRKRRGGLGGRPGLLFHFLWKENWRKNRRQESPPPGAFGESPSGWGWEWGSLAGQGLRGSLRGRGLVPCCRPSALQGQGQHWSLQAPLEGQPQRLRRALQL